MALFSVCSVINCAGWAVGELMLKPANIKMQKTGAEAGSDVKGIPRF